MLEISCVNLELPVSSLYRGVLPLSTPIERQ
jgi:hypothetical protein